jgi:uncharacterized membrane protein
MVIGVCTRWTLLAEEWPTTEIANRGSLSNFLDSLPVSFFSGLGVAVSILDEQTASLIGVAISASLLPPAVDAGMSIVTMYLLTCFQLTFAFHDHFVHIL